MWAPLVSNLTRSSQKHSRSTPQLPLAGRLRMTPLRSVRPRALTVLAGANVRGHPFGQFASQPEERLMRVRTLFAALVLVASVFVTRPSAQTPAANGRIRRRRNDREIQAWRERKGERGRAPAGRRRSQAPDCAYGPAARDGVARQRKGRDRTLPQQSQRAVCRTELHTQHPEAGGARARRRR